MISLGDDCGFDAEDDWRPARGDCWRESGETDVPVVRHRIGFVVGPRKPRVRVKAWTQQSGETDVPVVRHRIGFVVGPRKPRVRVKAWTQPVINER